MTKRLLILMCGLWLGSASLAFATDWYVDNAATGSNNGTSWTNAWTSFASIVWGASGVKAGDTLYISGGSTTKTYTTELVVGASGSSGSPITIRPGSASPSPSGHSGVVTITHTDGAGITITNKSYVTIDGNYQGKPNIRVTQNWTTTLCSTGDCGGIEVYWSANHIILQYLESDHNGQTTGRNEVAGIHANFSTLDTYPVLEVSHCKIHDNWQDQINVGYSGSQSPGPTPGVYGRWSIHDSEIYNGYDDFVQEGAPGLDFYNNSMHTHLSAYHNGVSVGHPDGLEISTHTTRIWNNVFYNMGNEAPYNDPNMGAYIYLSVYSDMPAGASVGGYQVVHDNLLYSTLATTADEYSTKGIELTPQTACCTSPTDALTHVYIYNNTIVGMPNNGINMMVKKGTQVTGPVGNLFVLNNLLYNNGRRVPGSTAAFSDSDRLQGTSGAVESTHTTGSWGDGKDLTVDWNMFNAGPAGSALIDYKSAYPLLTYAQFVAAETGGTGIHPQDGITTAVATADPLLTATYSPSATSPARGHGGDLTSLVGAPAYDRNGILRPSGAGWDIGSDQYTTTGTAPTCSYTLGTGSQSVAAAGGSGTVSVTTSAGCNWTTASNATWVTVTPATGSGPGTASFTVAANTTATLRTATLTIGGQPFTVTQAAAAATCTYALGSSGQSVAAAGGSGTVSVTTSAGCGWSTASSATWVTLTPATASGSGTASFTVAANTTTAARTATLTIGGQGFTVTQAAAVGGAAVGWAAASGGAQFGLAINADGTLWAWGLNDFGQLGDGTTTDRLIPVRIGADFGWSAVSPGWSHSLALKLDGTLWGWGLNNFGQVGDGTTATSRSVPTPIGSDNKWVMISAGYTHSLGLKSDGTLWAWGSNSHGQIGDGTTTDRSAPVQVGSEKTWVQISAGGYHSLALKSDGTLWAWGFNGDQYNWGQLGDGTNIERHSPVQVGSENTWRVISAGFAISAGIKANGTLWTWGGGHMGEQAQGDWTSRVVPTQVGSGTSWVAVAAKNDTLHVIKSDGTLWGAGDNTYGQLGDGTLTSETTLVQIGSDNKWRTVPRADFYALGVKSDGSVWAWGRNEHGAMGDGTTTNRNSPVQIPAPPPKGPASPTNVMVKMP